MNNAILTQVLSFASILAVFVMSIVQLVKTALNINKNFVPVVGVLVGLLIGVVAYPFTDMDLVLRLWSGGLAGLSATGLFELAFNKRDGNTRGKEL